MLEFLKRLFRRPPAEAGLLRSEEHFDQLVSGVRAYAIFLLDPEGNVATWNAGAERIKGYKAAEIIGQHFSRFYPVEAVEAGLPAHELEVASATGRFEDEGWRVRKDGSRFWANVIITALYDKDRRLRGFARVTRDLTVRRRVEALQETERQMNEFLAMLAHELRNPLAAIVNALGLMRSKKPHDQAWLRDVIDRQAAHLTRIVDDLLDVSRITRGRIDLKRELLDLNDLVSRVVEACRPSIDARRHHLELQLAQDALPVDVDSTRLAQVVHNLISNAVKYTPEAGQISIHLALEGGKAVLRVRDSGIGMPADLLPKVFDLFVQGDRSLDRTEGGLGIGLTLVRRLVEMHGGSVAAFSEGAGDGSEFVVRLPLALGRAATPRMLAAEPESHPRIRRRLLVVDDNRDFANTLSLLLETFGHEVRTVYDGRAVVPMATDYRPDAVLLDIGLPGMNGYEIARELRSAPALAQVTLVAFTGYGQDEDRRRVREAGFDFHLVKPVEVGELTRVIDALPS